MDYGKLSDYEINKRVAMLIGGYLDEDFFDAQSVIFKRHGKFQYSFFEPCINPVDAWPIMIENKISIMWMAEEKQWCAWANGELEEGCWEWMRCPDEYHNDDNPLRAAMIVFLMMQESANVQDNPA